jgi:hypothetical protein
MDMVGSVLFDTNRTISTQAPLYVTNPLNSRQPRLRESQPSLPDDVSASRSGSRSRMKSILKFRPAASRQPIFPMH